MKAVYFIRKFKVLEFMEEISKKIEEKLITFERSIVELE
jgi:hypothetical protein